MNPRVSKVRPLKGHRLKLVFTNGESGVYDCSPLLDFGVFKDLRDERYFGRACVREGTVAWPREQDIDPDTLYQDSRKAPRRQPASARYIGKKRVPACSRRYG
jgi:hypothetical protein